MLAPSRSIDESITAVREEDRPWAAMVHALGAIPVWGFVFNAIVWMYYRNRSREMIFQVQQAIQYHFFVLLPVLTWVVCSLLAKIITGLSPALGGFFQVLNNILLSICLTGTTGLALYGACLVYIGRPFLYPLIGRRVLEGTIRKFSEE